MIETIEEIFGYAPKDATHYNNNNQMYYKFIGDAGLFWNDSRSEWLLASSRHNYPAMIERPTVKQWSGPEDGLPPVGADIEIKIDYKKAPPYAIINLTELGVDVMNHTPRFQKAKVLYASAKYLITDACGSECLTPMSCVEIRPIRKPDPARETAIRELMDIAQVDCRVTAARLVDAGFKR